MILMKSRMTVKSIFGGQEVTQILKLRKQRYYGDGMLQWWIFFSRSGGR